MSFSIVLFTAIIFFLLVMYQKGILWYLEMRGFLASSILAFFAILSDFNSFQLARFFHITSLVTFTYFVIIRMRKKYRYFASVISFLLGINLIIIHQIPNSGIRNHPFKPEHFYLLTSFILSSFLFLYYLHRKDRFTWDWRDLGKFTVIVLIYLVTYYISNGENEEITYELSTSVVFAVAIFVIGSLPSSEILFYGVLEGIIYRNSGVEYLFINPEFDGEEFTYLVNSADGLMTFSKELLEAGTGRKTTITYGNLSIVFSSIEEEKELLIIYKSKLQNFDYTLMRIEKHIAMAETFNEPNILAELLSKDSKTKLVPYPSKQDRITH